MKYTQMLCISDEVKIPTHFVCMNVFVCKIIALKNKNPKWIAFSRFFCSNFFVVVFGPYIKLCFISAGEYLKVLQFKKIMNVSNEWKWYKEPFYRVVIWVDKTTT